MEKEKNIEYNLDICKIIGAFLIVAIHCRPLTSLSDLMDFYLVDIVARLAVPFFFATTGYLLFRKFTFSEDGRIIKCYSNDKILLRYIKRIFILYISWSLIYLVVWQIPYWNSIGWSGIKVVIDYSISFFIKGSVYHFWYFVSLLYGVIILYLLLRNIRMKFSICLAIIFYFVKAFIYGYSWINDSMFGSLNKIWNIFNGPFDGIGIALPFMMVGVIVSQRNMLYRVALKYKKIGLEISFIGLIIEASALFFEGRNEGKYSYILFTLPMCLFLFINILENSWGVSSDKLIFGIKLRKYSTVVFCIHPLIINLLGFSEKFNSFNSLIKYISVISITIVIATFMIRIRNKGNIKVLSFLM